MTNEIMEVYAQIYNWGVDSKGRPVPPYVMHPLPDFVMKRIKWVSDEAKRSPMSLFGSCMQVVDVDHEDRLKEQWEFGAASDYLPMSKEYKDWFNDPDEYDLFRISTFYDNYYGQDRCIVVTIHSSSGNEAKTWAGFFDSPEEAARDLKKSYNYVEKVNAYIVITD